MKHKTGGAAFPSTGIVLDEDTKQRQQGAYEGMSLRDWFAGMALQGIIASNNYTEDYAVELAYDMADSMLRIREVNK